jgi:hypothetical protein
MNVDRGIGLGGLLVGIPGLIQVCLQVGGRVLQLVDDYRNADAIANQLVLKLKMQWKTMEDILHNLERIAAKLGVELEKEILQMLHILCDSLRRAMEKASRLGMLPAPGKEAKVNSVGVMWSKSDLEKILSECQEWESIISKRLVIVGLSKMLTEDADGQVWKRPVKRLHDVASQESTVTRTRITWSDGVERIILPNEYTFGKLPCSSIRYVSDTRGNLQYLVESPHVPLEMGPTLNDSCLELFRYGVYNTARMLKGAESSYMSILHCPGIRYDQDLQTHYELIYTIPPDHFEPQSLRALLTSPDARNEDGLRHPLDQRFRLADRLATAVLYVHSGHFVHKHIKPENIIVFTTSETQKFPQTLGTPFLVGFDRSRLQQGGTKKRGDDILTDSVYQHPKRWGVTAEDRFTILHDIYSLGVVLLELGLWKPIVRWSSSRGRYISWSVLDDLIDGERQKLRPNVEPIHICNRFIKIASEGLPCKMGQKYANVVVACLTGNIEEGIDLGNDEKEAKVGLGYITNVVSKLEGLKI